MAESLRIETGVLDNPITTSYSGYYYNGYVYITTQEHIYKCDIVNNTSTLIYTKPTISSGSFVNISVGHNGYIYFLRAVTSGYKQLQFYRYSIETGETTILSQHPSGSSYYNDSLGSFNYQNAFVYNNIIYFIAYYYNSGLGAGSYTGNWNISYNIETDTWSMGANSSRSSSFYTGYYQQLPSIGLQQSNPNGYFCYFGTSSYPNYITYRQSYVSSATTLSSSRYISDAATFWKGDDVYIIRRNSPILVYNTKSSLFSEISTAVGDFISPYAIKIDDLTYILLTSEGYLKLSFVDCNLTYQIKSNDSSVVYATLTDQAPIISVRFGFDGTLASYKITTEAETVYGKYQPQFLEGKTLAGYSNVSGSNYGNFLLFSDINQEIDTDFTFYEVYGTYRPPLVVDESIVGTWLITEEPTSLTEDTYEIEHYHSAAPYERYSCLISTDDGSKMYASIDGTTENAVLVYDNGWTNEDFRTVVITKDSDDDAIKEWVRANGEKVGDYEDVSVATINYEDDNIASLKVGQKATLTCQDQAMTDNILVSVDDNCVIPAGTIKVMANGIYPVIDKAGVVVDVPAVIEVDTLPTEDIDETVVYRVNEIIEEKSDRLFGTWKFNDTLEIDSVINQEISFTSGNYVCTGIEVDGSYSGYPTMFYVYTDEDGTSKTITAYTNGEWLQSELQTVTFDFDGQEVSEDYFAWHKVNANRYADSLNRYSNGAWTNYTEVGGSFEAVDNGVIDVTHYKQITINVAGGGDGNGIIEVDQLPRRGIYTNKVYLCNGALYRYVDEAWLEYMLVTNALTTKDGELFRVKEEPEA